jgi:hypothetical protein
MPLHRFWRVCLIPTRHSLHSRFRIAQHRWSCALLLMSCLVGPASCGAPGTAMPDAFPAHAAERTVGMLSLPAADGAALLRAAWLVR